MAHKVLADRMGLRDPGNKPQVNDRIPFVYIKVPPEKEIKLQGIELNIQIIFVKINLFRIMNFILLISY
jgi:hypothetical protein